MHHVETRAIVALLTRSIRIASEGADPVFDRKKDHFPPTQGNYYGGHTVVRDGFATLIDRAKRAAPKARIEGVLVAKQMQGGVECILGINRDPVFGPVAMFGLGGIFVEVMKDVVFRRCPFGADVAEAMIRSIKGAPLLLGARGRQTADIRALAEMLAKLSVFAHQAGPRLQSIDLNPVFAMPEGQGAFAADAVIEVGD